MDVCNKMYYDETTNVINFSFGTNIPIYLVIIEIDLPSYVKKFCHLEFLAPRLLGYVYCP
jgi:hypothetical protein